jgi:hypothetical protein
MLRSHQENSVSNREPDKLSRRAFARDTALLAATVALLPAELLAQTQTPASKPPAPSSQPELSPASKQEVEDCYKTIIDRFGSRFSEEQKRDVHRLLLAQQSMIDSLRAYKLENSDEPATVLKLEGAVKATRA